ncbi:MAG: ATP-binding protein, partial [Planctomycetota bacterium]
LGDPRLDCRCTPPLIERYRSRISGPLLDRIDLHVEVPALSLHELKGPPSEPTVEVAHRVTAARTLQSERFGVSCGTPVNAAMDPEQLRRHCVLHGEARTLLDGAFERLKLSARALTRILKVSRTIADLAGEPEILVGHIAEAIQYRSLDRRLDRY